MSQAINQAAIDAFAALLPGAFTVSNNKGAARAAQGHTLEEARSKCITNIEANIAALQGGAAVDASKLLYKPVNDASTAVGAKYGNAWVVCMPKSNGQRGKFVHVAPDAVVETLEGIKAYIAAGHADDALQVIRESNQGAAVKRREKLQ